MRPVDGSLRLCATAACLFWLFPAFGSPDRSVAAAEEQGACYVMPYKADPPIAVDGKLDDWGNVPNAILLIKKEQVTYQVGKGWTGPDDLSGTVHLAWRDGIYIAVEVTDDAVLQPYSGTRIYQGDHFNLWLDLMPALERGRTLFGEGQYHIAISPSNFGGKAGGDTPIPPEIVVYLPEGMPQEGGQVASRRTEKGYVIEAFVPFSRLKAAVPQMNQVATFEVAIGESDTTPSRQETFMTSGTAQWKYLRSRMLPMVFGSGSGTALLPSRTVPIAKSLAIQKKAHETVKFTMATVDPAYDPFLFFRGRMDHEIVAGYSGAALTVDLNGERIRGQALANRGMTATMEDNRDLMIASADGRLSLPHAPDFTSTDESTTGYALRGGVKSTEFELYVGGLLKEGENTLLLSHISTDPLHSFICLADMELRLKPHTAGSRFFKSAATGPLPTYEPQRAFPKTYSALKQAAARISLAVGKDAYAVESRFSTPDGGWQTGSNKYFSHERKVIEHDEWVEVRDTFRNLTQDNLPIIQEHKCLFEKEAEGVWFAGNKKPFKTGRISGQVVFENGTVFATTSDSGIGMAPMNDEFMVHIELAGDQGKWVRIADPFFVLKKGAEYTAEWAIVPVTKPDYFAFVNAARRMLDTNFTLKYMFAFVFGTDMLYKWRDEDIKKFIENKSANFMVQSNEVHLFNGLCAHGTPFLKIPYDGYIHFQENARRIWPDRSRKTGIYYHCFLDVDEASIERFAADRVLDANGVQIGYGGPTDKAKVYLPTLKNQFGKEMAQVVDVILDKIGADGIYWDEFSFSKVEYAYNMWDGCSAEIDPQSHQITRLTGSLPLMSQEFRAAQVKRILDRGAPLVVNSQPFTRTMRRFKFQAFVETGSGPANCMRTHLYSPVILGDHITEETYKEIYQNMLQGLDYGCLYAYYYIRPMPNKTLAEYMYPFTPIELHEGYVIGQERILTNRSGQFGWGDASDFTAHVYDRDTKETAGTEVKKVLRDGRSYAEVRIPEGYSVAIVRAAK